MWVWWEGENWRRRAYSSGEGMCVEQYNVEVKSMHSTARVSRSKSWLSHLLPEKDLYASVDSSLQ